MAVTLTILVSDDAVLAETERGGLLFHRETKEGFRLDHRQLAMWNALRTAHTFDAAARHLAATLGFDATSIPSELATFVDALSSRKLVRLDGGIAPWFSLLVAQHGLAKALPLAARVVARPSFLFHEARFWLAWWLDRGFDRRFRTETVRLGTDDDPGASAARRYVNGYDPTPTRAIRAALRSVPSPHDFIFIDVGSGKGKVLLLASHVPFKRVIGVELSDSLHLVAQRNIASYRDRRQACHDITSVCQDFLKFDLPDDDLVLYFREPFRGAVLDEMFERFRTWTARYRRRLIIILYGGRPSFVAPFRSFDLVKLKADSIPWLLQPHRDDRLLVFSSF